MRALGHGPSASVRLYASFECACRGAHRFITARWWPRIAGLIGDILF